MNVVPGAASRNSARPPGAQVHRSGDALGSTQGDQAPPFGGRVTGHDVSPPSSGPESQPTRVGLHLIATCALRGPSAEFWQTRSNIRRIHPHIALQCMYNRVAALRRKLGFLARAVARLDAAGSRIGVPMLATVPSSRIAFGGRSRVERVDRGHRAHRLVLTAVAGLLVAPPRLWLCPASTGVNPVSVPVAIRFAFLILPSGWRLLHCRSSHRQSLGLRGRPATAFAVLGRTMTPSSLKVNPS